MAEPLVEVELPAGSLVIGDLHLDVEERAAVDGFLSWLEQRDGCPRLVVLGDLFEYWVGPAQARGGAARRVVEALAARVAAGTAIDVIPGNRDFLLDRSFEVASGCRVHPRGFVGCLAGGERVLFVHGDELSTLDHAYQRLRRVIRSAPVRGLARLLPLWATERIARRLRSASRKAVARKPRAETALQPDACRTLARAADAGTLVCGHAHTFRDERLEDGPRWLVVDAFGGKRDTLEVGPGGELGLRAARP